MHQPQRRRRLPLIPPQVLLLATSQALFQTVAIAVVTIGGLAGASVAASPSWATLPIAAMLLGTATTTIPASLWMARRGRRSGFVLGALTGAVGAIVAALGVWVGSLTVLACGTFLMGIYQGFAQYYRFAAIEVAPANTGARAISYVLAAGVVAALAGPALGQLGAKLFARDYVGSFVLASFVALAGAALLLRLRVPSTARNEAANVPARSWRAVVTQPRYLVALLGGGTGLGVMVLAMTATPIAMVHHDHGLGDAASVIQMHTLAMFLPSFITGSLIARFGALRIMLAGVAAFALHVAITASGTEFHSFAAALVMLGVGWNFLYIGGTALLSTTYTPAEMSRAQATNDMVIFAIGLVCSVSAAALLSAYGWQRLNFWLWPWIAFTAMVLLVFDRRAQDVERNNRRAADV